MYLRRRGGDQVLINKKEIAQKTGMSITSIDRLMTKGLPYYKLGKSVRFEYDKVLEWIKKQNE